MMNHAQRTTAIFEFLHGQKAGLLRRYTAPDHLSQDRMRDEINDLVDDINVELPAQMTESRLGLIFEKLRPAIRRRHGARTWPTTKILVASLKDVFSELDDQLALSDDDVLRNRVQMVASWFDKFRSPMPCYNTPEITRALIGKGDLKDERQAHFYGFDLTIEDRRKVDGQRMSDPEFNRHCVVMARLTGLTVEDARALETQLVADETLPESIAQAVMKPEKDMTL